MPPAMDDQPFLVVARAGEAEDAARLVVRRLDVVEAPRGPELLRHGFDFTGSRRYKPSRVFRRLLPLAALAVGFAVAPAQAGVAHHNPIGMADPTGDGNGAPDIVRVTIANDLRNRLLFVVQVTNREDLVAGDLVFLRIDSDRNAQTGEPDRGAGIDYMIEVNVSAEAVSLRRWNGNGFERAETTLSFAYNGGYAILIDRADVGAPPALRFYVLTALDGPGARVDAAPDAGTYDYELSVSHVDAMTPRWTPRAPRAGSSFRLSALRLTLQTGDSVPAARFRCQARLARVWLRGTGRGTCTFRLPRTARGKRLTLFVTASPARGEAETGQQTFRVR